MKKFMKRCAITALILLVLGFALAIAAGTVEGAGRISNVVESVTGGRVHVNLTDPDDWGVFIGEEDWEDAEIFYDIDDDMMFETDFEILRGDIGKFTLGNNIRNLDIAAGGCMFYFRQSEDNNFYIEADNAGKFQSYVKDDTLYIKTTRTVSNVTDYDDSEIIFYMPANYRFDNIKIELGAGALEIGELSADEAEMEVGAGQITVEYLQADKSKMKVGMGEIVIDDMQVVKMDAEVGMGHLQMDGTILGDVEAECSMGAIELYLTGREEDFNYSLEAAMGSVTIGNEDYSGLAHEKTVENSADKNMSIECAMGSIEVDFEE